MTLSFVEDALPILHIPGNGPTALITTVHGIKHSQNATLGDYLADVESRLAACKGTTVVVSTPTISGDSFIAIGFPLPFQLAARPGLSYTSIASFEVTTTLGTQTIPATDNAATVTITPPVDTPENSTLTLTVIATDSEGYVSNPGTHEVVAVKAAILAPTLITPVEGAEIVDSGVAFGTSPFVACGLEDTHSASEFRILDMSDTEIYSSGEVKTLLKHVALKPSLVRGDSYRMQARHKGTLFGWSEWGPLVTVSIMAMGHGMRIDNMATVIGPFFYSGKNRFIAVLDAAFRGSSNMLSSAATITKLPLRDSAVFPSIGGTISVDEPWETTLARANDPNSSKFNTDFWQTQSGLASNICRKIILESSPCDLPNAPAAMAIWKYRKILDSVDPTVAANPAKSLANWNYSANWGYVRTSSLSAEDSTANTLITSSGTFSYAVFDQYAGFILPILEIDV